jgi:pilus assembly protein Flp/PilA
MGNLGTLIAHPRSAFARFLAARRAVTAIEYALIAALIAVVIIGAVSLVGNNISSEFNTVASDL